jgi:hypothetical protein
MDIAWIVFWTIVALCSAIVLSPFIFMIALTAGSIVISILATLIVGTVSLLILGFWILPKYIWSKIRPISKKEILNG